jgi:putative DNA primase/helicase
MTMDSMQFPASEHAGTQSVTEDSIQADRGFPAGGVPEGFKVDASGVFERTGDDDAPRWLCSPLRVVNRFRTPDGSGWGRTVEILAPDGKVVAISILEKQLASGKSALIPLVDRGLQISPLGSDQTTIVSLLRKWTDLPLVVSVRQPGWTDGSCESFLFGHGGVIGKAGYVLNTALVGSRGSAANSSGTAPSWIEGVGKRCSGNPTLVLAVSTALAGPLLALLGLDLGGGIHLRGASSSGKTTAARLAASVWGPRTFMSTWRATANGLEDMAVLHNDTVLVLDELGEITPHNLDEATYLLANGREKHRKAGVGQSTSSRSWRVMVVSTGELSLADRLAEGRRDVRQGQEVRLIDVAADLGRFGAFDDLHGEANGALFSQLLKTEADRHFGTSGPAFVDGLVRLSEAGRLRLKQHFNQYTARLSKRCHADRSSLADRIAMRLALIALAGDVATTFGLTGWKKGEGLTAAALAMDQWLERFVEPAVVRGEGYLDRLRNYLNGHPGDISDLSSADSAASSTTVLREGEIHYFPSEVWQHLFPNDEGRIAAQSLRDAGVLVPGDGNNLMKRAPRSITNRPRFYVVRIRSVPDLDTGKLAA